MSTPDSPPETFSFVVIPDTQVLARDHPDVLLTMARWIREHTRELSLRAVVHLGDIVDHGARDELQFRRSLEAFAVLESAGMPLLLAAGNHDYDDPITSKRGPVPEERSRDLVMFNQYFGQHRLDDQPWFGGTFEPQGAENMYAVLGTTRESFLFVVLEFAPRPAVMAWADDVIRAHPRCKVVVITHSYMFLNGERVNATHPANPKRKYPAAATGRDGEDMWTDHLSHHPNLLAVFAGHHIPGGAGHRVDLGVHGNAVYQFFQNWQDFELGGGGRFRIVTYDETGPTLRIRVVNPTTGRYESEPGYELTALDVG